MSTAGRRSLATMSSASSRWSAGRGPSGLGSGSTLAKRFPAARPLPTIRLCRPAAASARATGRDTMFRDQSA